MKRKAKYTPNYDHMDYMNVAMRPEVLRKALPKIKAILKDVEFDAIAFRGMSGAILAPIIAMRERKSLIMVRKPKDDSHSSRTVEGDRGAKKYIIVDDFMQSGKTARAIKTAIADWAPKAECLGVLEVKWIAEDKRRGISEVGSWS